MSHDPSRFLLAVFSIETAFQSHACFFRCGCCSEREKQDPLLDVAQFRSECQECCFGSDPAWILWIECGTSEVVSNAQAHQVIASELLAGQAIASCFIHLPGPGQIFVGNALMAEVAIWLAPGQDIP